MEASPHYSVLLAVIHDEDLFRLRHRLKKVLEKKGPNPDIERWVQVLTLEFDKREAEHVARVEAIRQAG